MRELGLVSIVWTEINLQGTHVTLCKLSEIYVLGINLVNRKIQLIK